MKGKRRFTKRRSLKRRTRRLRMSRTKRAGMLRHTAKAAAKQVGNVLKEVVLNEGQTWTKGQDTLYDKYGKLQKHPTPTLNENVFNQQLPRKTPSYKGVEYDIGL